ncbi:MAG TPA: ankyrin repeat domain-containing protein [Thermoanaerobaculia bacterium]|nr:ankyrin repeat domain-containing protein [Thermoanaerobaculia bacterium]
MLRALPLLQSSADTWFRKRPCASCHHQGLGMMAVSLARERGLPIDAALLATQVDKTLRDPSRKAERMVLGEASINEAISQSYRLLGVAAAGAPAGSDHGLVTHMLAGKQHVSGRWVSVSHRPPLEDTDFTATAVTIRALRLFPPAGREREMDAQLARARAWLESASPASTEDQSMQLLGLVWSGASSESVEPKAEDLWAAQREDGGWAQIPMRESDAYATGQALVALHLAGSERPHDIARGIELLLRTQQADGSWQVTTRRGASPGLPYFDSGFPHGEDQFISYAGSAWATMALILATGEGTTEALVGGAAVTATGSSPGGTSLSDELPPLLRTALAGSLEELQAALAKGANPNAATPSGLTALMCAVQDPRKVAALLEAGARPDAATTSGHTALLLAAGYDGAEESVRLLLEAGAEAQASTSSAMTPLLRAVLRGDQEVAALLLERGVRISGSDRQRVPLHLATWGDDAAMASFLLDRGAAVDERSHTGDGALGETGLMMAVADGLVTVTRLLISRGADVNARDAEGFTPLMLAAGAADRGSSEILDALLAAGADPSVESQGGQTALSIAQWLSRDAGIAALERALRR